MTEYDDDQRELVALYAVDALDDLDRARAERLVASSSEAARDLARYSDALAAMIDDSTAVAPPARSWDAIAETVRATRPGRSPGAAIDAVGDTSTGFAAGADDEATLAPAADLRARRRPVAARWLAVAAAVLVAVAAAVSVRALTSGTESYRSQMAAALARPGTRAGELTGSAGSARVALAADGTGWVDVSTLPDPGAGNVYQLWSLDSGTPVSLGVVTPSAGVARFTAPAGSTTLALSKERAPGAASPTLPPVGAVTLS